MQQGQKNILSIDFEEWFQVNSFESIIRREEWSNLEKRLPYQLELLLDLFSEYNVKVTFFIVGWTAGMYPDLIKKIVQYGHEVGCHGFLHKTLPSLGPKKFKEDSKKAKGLLENITGEKVIGYRAPAWSLNKYSMWAVDILNELGFVYDSSIYPISLRYGQRNANRFCFKFQSGLLEFPLSTLRIFNHNIPVGGGAFFRVQPGFFTRLAIKEYNKKNQPFVIYLHTWEFDPDHPRVKTNLKRYFIHYYNINTTSKKIRCLLDEFEFTNFKTYIETNSLR